jgi:hypothetical protein
MLRRIISLVWLATAFVVVQAPLWAQSPPEQTPPEQAPSEQDPPEQAPPEQATPDQTPPEQASPGEKDAHASTDVVPSPDEAPEPDFPSAPSDRLEQAEKAFQDADYHHLRPLLVPTLEPDSRYSKPEEEIRARTLLGVGLYFEAQQVTDATRRRELLDRAQAQFLEILRKEPDHSLNALIYPASVAELFEAVKEEHAAELDKIRAERDESNGNGAQKGLKSVYIERELSHRPYAGNFMPFGVGQFQNGEPIQGALFAGAQVAAIGLNVTGYTMIELLRDPETGRYEPGAGNAAEQARQWRVGQYVGLGLFVGFYAWSIIDALRDYRAHDVRIRTLDEPPPELASGDADDKGPSFQIGLGGLGLSW